MDDSMTRQAFCDSLPPEQHPPLALLPERLHRWDCATRSGILLSPEEIGAKPVKLLPDVADTQLIARNMPALMTWTFWFPLSDVGLVFVQAYQQEWPKGSLSGSSTLSIEIEPNYSFPSNLADVPEGGLRGVIEHPTPGDAYVRKLHIQQPVYKVPFQLAEHSYACSLPHGAQARKHYIWLR